MIISSTRTFYCVLAVLTALEFCPIGQLYARQPASPAYELWYDKPADGWNSALPVGNGRLGAMVFGGVIEERIQFNEETLWEGEPRSYARNGAADHLDEIRRLLFDHKQEEAHKLAMEQFMSIPLNQMAYQPFGDLLITTSGHENYTDYKRTLDLGNAVTNVTYKVGNVLFEREVLASFPDQVIAIEFRASEPGALSFDLRMASDHKENEVSDDGRELYVKVADGVTRSGENFKSLLFGKAKLKVFSDGEIHSQNSRVTVSNAGGATVYLAAATNFKSYGDVSGDPDVRIDRIWNRLDNKAFNEVKNNHLADFRSLFGRFDISFGENEKATLPTDQRILQFRDSAGDPGLIALYVQYGRYLMLASSREGTYAANLQGIWNDKLKPAWESKYTLNINAEMNYWLSEVGNISETHDAFFNMIDEIVASGRITAEKHYNSPGWVAHHNTDIWRGTAPINHSNHGIFLGSGGWLATHLWEHYLYTQDLHFLKNRAYPVMEESALFYSNNLIKDPETGWLVSTPSNSPETGGLVYGPAMDHQIIRALFESVIVASELVDADRNLPNRLKELLPEIAPNQVGRYGQLQEWVEDKDDTTSTHRHVSHLWGLHPGKEINWEDTPELMEAARQSLKYRGDDGTGWSLAWKINFWARLLDGDHAYELIEMLFRPVNSDVTTYGPGGGSYPNLFDAHPPFQIDGNFGAPAGILELLMQSHLDRIDILPALPNALPNGEVKGIRARGGFELDFNWQSGEIQTVRVKSIAGRPCTIKYKDKAVELTIEKGQVIELNNQLEII